MKRYIRSSSDDVCYRVDIILEDGTKEYFDTFVSEDMAHYNIALAQATHDSYYRSPKYDGAEWIITEEERVDSATKVNSAVDLVDDAVKQRLRRCNQTLCQDAADYLEDPWIAAREKWSDAYYHEVMDCINEVRAEVQSR